MPLTSHLQKFISYYVWPRSTETIGIILVSVLKVFEVLCLPSSKVDDLKEKLAAQEVELKQKNEDADLLIKKVHIAIKQSTMVTCVCSITRALYM